MPYIKRESYQAWCQWVNCYCEKLALQTAGKRSYRLGARYNPPKLVLIDDLHDKVIAKGMKDITRFIMMLEKRYKL